MSVVKLGSENQKRLKSVSKAIEVIAKICRICIYVGIGALIFVMFLVPVIMNKVEVKNDTLMIDNVGLKVNDTTIKILDQKDNVVMNVDDKDLSKTEALGFELVKDILNNYSKAELTASIEFGLLSIIVSLLVSSFVFKYLEKLFKNINKEDKPFTMENANYFRKIGRLLIWVIIISFATNIVFSVLYNFDFGYGFELTDIILILGAYALAYIFEYGYNLQGKSKSVIYGDTKE